MSSQPLVADGVEVAENLDAPTVVILANLILLSDVDRERATAHLRRVSEFELVRLV
jgi:hypothetical protein